MHVFLDNSKKRKNRFRTAVVITSITIFTLGGLFIINAFFGQSLRQPVKYKDVTESYHYYYSAANDNKIAITFDNGPSYKVTDELTQILKKDNVPATFFFAGQNILLEPNVVKDVSEQGFDIGNNSFTHDENVDSSQNRMEMELHSTEYLISKITGVSPIYYRPPFLLGIGVDPTINPYIPLPKDMLWTLEDGYIPVGSDINPKYWLSTTSEALLAEVKSSIQSSKNGHILLLSEEQNTADVLDKIIAYVREEGYSIVPLKELLTPPQEIILTHNLQIGSTDKETGGEVSKLQWFLYKRGELDPYLITGVFSTQTYNALANFQLRNKLIDPTSVDPARVGIADKKTRDLIQTISTTNTTESPATPQTSLAAILSTIAKSPARPQALLAGVGALVNDAIKYSYVNFFSAIRLILIGGIWLTLILVILRCFIFGFLILYEKYLKKRRRSKKERPKHTGWRGVSVLIPAYNEEQNIRSTVESIIRSTYRRKEILVIDDGSTDKTAEIVQSVIAENPKESIRLLKVKNGGKARALNYGVNAARYGVCAVLDADTVLEPHALYYFVRHFSDPDVGAVAGKVKTTGQNKFLDLFQTLEYGIGQNIDKRALSIIGSVGVVPGPAGIWNREYIIRAGGFDTDTLVEDQDMTLRLLSMGKKIIYEPRAIAYTETPHSLKNFLKQRFRWVYGTMQCFWKNKKILIERPLSNMSLVVMPNTFIFNILLPLTYPLADSAFILGILTSDWKHLIIPYLYFTAFDLIYATLGMWGEAGSWKLLFTVPLQRVTYRQLLYYTVAKSVVRAIEGTGSGWNKFAKTGETQRFYFSSVSPIGKKPELATQEIPAEEESQIPTERTPEQQPFQKNQEVPGLGWTQNAITGVETIDQQNTYAKSTSSVDSLPTRE